MSIKDRLAGKSANVGLTIRPQQKDTLDTEKPKTGVGHLMSALPMLAEKDDEILDLKKQLVDAKENASPLEISLELLHEVKGRRRKLTEEQFRELRENLRNNPLVSAITVRPRREGGYEIISGHNRVAAFRELGRQKILAVIINSDDAQTELSAFYANLLQNKLPDYEKYLGFKKRQKATNKTQTDLAQEAGVSTAYVSLLMAFDKLPKEITTILDRRPEIIGANAAEEFSKLIEHGRLNECISAIALLEEDKLSQAAALRMASKISSSTAPAPSQKFRAGKSVVAEMRGADRSIRLSFRSIEEREAVEKLITAVVQEYAKTRKI